MSVKPKSVILWNQNLVFAYNFEDDITDGVVYDQTSHEINANVVGTPPVEIVPYDGGDDGSGGTEEPDGEPTPNTQYFVFNGANDYL